jgi:hypothetical protein
LTFGVSLAVEERYDYSGLRTARFSRCSVPSFAQLGTPTARRRPAREDLLAFSGTCRYFCPSCHAKRLAIWTQWLDTTRLASVGVDPSPATKAVHEQMLRSV